MVSIFAIFAMRMGFKENEILRGSTSLVSPFMMNVKRYTALHVYTDIIQNQLLGDVRATSLRLIPVNRDIEMRHV